ncbi:hypothetical protein N7471_006216 [Penicillium samsonianum]|uniref:uncharacterized protein n=1 Tax=Penicillium samsonianum TaxID=1882272 RepID=UPI002546F8C0|nr:uncharacterized protein N7471_006216 [Penicillium samsonianum]KAJ6139730.1 hypothetical protein N7471_006216 [Penicillium samsonianum]
MNDERNNETESQRPGNNHVVNGGWVPWTLRLPFLCSLAGFLLLFGIALEVIRQLSERNNGLIIYKTVNEIPKVISGAYVYVPVSLGVVAVTLWQFCVGDALRLEPYFQLARPEGVSATVLFTNYNFFYGVMAPVTAARNRHWLIFVITTLSMAFRILLPSSLAGLVVLTETSLDQTFTVSTWPKLLDQDTQTNWFAAEAIRYTDASVVRTADDIFLSRSSEYASAAVSMPLDENETSMLSINQTVYWSELSCQNVSHTNITWARQTTTDTNADHDSSDLKQLCAMQIEFPSSDNDHPCTVDFALNTTLHPQRGPLQLRYWEPIRAQSVLGQDSAFQTTHCENYAFLGFLIDIAENAEVDTGRSPNGTAFACHATYQSAEAELKIAVDASITEAKVDSSSRRDLRDAEFFGPGFHDLLYHKSRRAISLELQIQSGIMETSVNHTWLVPSGPNFNLDQEILSHSVDLPAYQDAILHFWNSQFIVTMNKLFDVTAPVPLEATQVTTLVALDVLSNPAVIAEALLFAAATLLLILAAVYPRRATFLRSDPGSIAAQCTIIADLFVAEGPLAQSSEIFSHATSHQLLRWAKNFRCEWSEGPAGKKIDIVPLPSSIASGALALPPARRRTDRRPHFVILHWFLVECMLLTGTLVTYGFALSFLSLKDVNAESAQQIGLLIFLLFGPTFISSLVSSLLASILRHLTIIETWGRLQKGMAGMGASLAKNYGSHISISVLFHNLCEGPLLVTALSIICTLGLSLTIISGGMFEPQTKLHKQAATGLSAQYNGTTFQLPTSNVQFDGIGLVLSNLNRGTPIVPWQDEKHSFLPLSNSEVETNGANNFNYEAVTLGIGASLQCHQVLLDWSKVENGSGTRTWNYTSPSGFICTVEAPNRVEGGLIKRSISYLQPDGVSYAETGCQSTILILARWETTQSSPSNSQSSIALSCQPSITSEGFEVVFDHRGIVSSSKPTTTLAMHDRPISQNLSLPSLVHLNRAIMSLSNPYNPLGNVSFFHYDWPGMMTALTYDRLYHTSQLSFDATSLMSAAQSTYQQILSTYLTFNRDLYFQRYAKSAAPRIEGTVTKSLWGLFPSAASIMIALVLLSLDIIIVVFIFVARSNYFRAPRNPNSLGSLIPWVAGSEMMTDLREMARMGKRQFQQFPEQNQFYRFGLSRDMNGNERWLLDYDHSGLQGAGNELSQIPTQPRARRRHRSISCSSESVGGEMIALPSQPIWFPMGIFQGIVDFAKRRAKRPQVPS